MEQKYFTNERNVQILIVLLKKYGIRKVIASPGTTNITFVASLMHDPYFELYSSVDERSAAYIACGLAEESGEPVVITCTGATASRNYVSGLTEAYYRHLPIIAVTATRDVSKIGHLNDQVIDRSQFLADTVKYSTLLQTVVNEKDEWDCTIKVNRALQELTRHGGGPVHINLTTTYSRDYKTQNIPDAKRIYKYYINDTFPELPQCRIGIHIGTHHKLSLEETEAIDNFCHCHNAVVFCEPNSGYSSKYRIPSSSVKEAQYPDLIIHLGDVCTFIPEMYGCKDVWRVHPDGEIRDRVQKLSKVFEMDIKTFFNYYANIISDTSDSYYKECRECYNNFVANIPELPFSNLWIANEFRKIIPEFSELPVGGINLS